MDETIKLLLGVVIGLVVGDILYKAGYLIKCHIEDKKNNA